MCPSSGVKIIIIMNDQTKSLLQEADDSWDDSWHWQGISIWNITETLDYNIM